MIDQAFVIRLENKILELERQVAMLEKRLNGSGLYSTSFLTRSFTAWGHVFLAQFLIGLMLAFLIVMLGIQ